MNEIQFTAIVGPDGVIRPPIGVVLPPGTVEVIVRPESLNANADNKPALTHGWLLAMVRELESSSVVLPADMAENHDYYAHGKPRG